MLMPQEQNGKVVTQRPTREASQGWKNGKLQAWIVDVYQSINCRWVKPTGKVIWLLNSRGTRT